MELNTHQKIATKFAILAVILLAVFSLSSNKTEKTNPLSDEMTDETTNEITESENKEEGSDKPTAKNPSSSNSTKEPAAKPVTKAPATCRPSLSASVIDKPRAINLKWSPCTNDNFQLYRLIKSAVNNTPTYPADTVILTSNSQSQANHIDKTVAAGTTYYYRLCVTQRLADETCGNVASIKFE